MVKFMKGALLAGVASFALTSVASAAPISDAEFKCQAGVSKAGAKFVAAKAKCASKCLTNARKPTPIGSPTDCFPPYAGFAQTCIITDPLKPGKSAEEKFAAAIKKACDPATKPGAECPNCYSGGDCSDTGEANDRVQNIEGQVDFFGPSVFCDQDNSNLPNADADETKCQLNTAKVLSKQVATINKCYDKCKSNARKDLIPDSACGTPIPSDPATQACIAKGDTKSVSSIDKKCSLIGAIPDCTAPDDYPNGSSWVTVVDAAIIGNQPGTYCSPSGAFLD
jgi:hypothetical protein